MADRNGTHNDFDRLLTERDLGLLQFSTLLYYLHETNPDNGLVRDKTDPTAPVSIAAGHRLTKKIVLLNCFGVLVFSLKTFIL